MITVGDYIRVENGKGPVYSKCDKTIACCGFSDSGSKCEFYVRKKNYLYYLVSKMLAVNPKDMMTFPDISDFVDITCEYCRRDKCVNPEVKIVFAMEEL